MSNLEKNNVEFYIHTSSGELALVEIFNEFGYVSLIVAGKRMDLERDSAFDLADALLMAADNLRVSL